MKIMSSATGKRKDRESLGRGLFTVACFLMYQDFVYKIVGITLVTLDINNIKEKETDLCLKDYFLTAHSIGLIFNYISVSAIGMAFYGLLTRRRGYMVPYILLIPISMMALLSYRIYMRKVPCVENYSHKSNGKQFWFDVSVTVYYFCYLMFLDMVYDKCKIKKTEKNSPYVTII